MSSAKKSLITPIFGFVLFNLFFIALFYIFFWLSGGYTKEIIYKQDGYLKNIGYVESYNFINPYHYSFGKNGYYNQQQLNDTVYIVDNKSTRRQRSNYSNYGSILTDNETDLLIYKKNRDNILSLMKKGNSDQKYISKDLVGFTEDGRSIEIYRLNNVRASFVLNAYADYNYAIVVRKNSNLKFNTDKVIKAEHMLGKTKDNDNVFLYRIDEKKESKELYHGYYVFYDIKGKESVTINHIVKQGSRSGFLTPLIDTTIIK